LTGLPWRATQSEADEAPGPTNVPGPVGSRKQLRLCSGSAPMPGRKGRWEIGGVSVSWPGVRRRAAKAEPALTPGRGGAQRSRLDLRTAKFGNAELLRSDAQALGARATLRF